jgi:hypothetical protein
MEKLQSTGIYNKREKEKSQGEKREKQRDTIPHIFYIIKVFSIGVQTTLK